MKKKLSLKKVINYVIGNIRYSLFYSRLSFLIRPHIREQIDVRIKSMDRECYCTGQCKMCGCKTTALQMVKDSCEGNCYPTLLNPQLWECLKKGYTILDIVESKNWRLEDGKFKRVTIWDGLTKM